MNPKPDLVDEAVRDQVARQLSAAVHEKVSVELCLQSGHTFRDVAPDQSGVPFEGLSQRP
jgi:hypothetical protein